MPYIRQERRAELLETSFPETAGELNFLLTLLVDGYLQHKGKNYENINACIGALECAKLELYRRIAAPYEDEKIIENGDVYE
jgi:hypothetical protein